MKKVLITGDNSYIGMSFETYCQHDFDIQTISVKGDDWKTFDFSAFDSIFHVAGLAHANPKQDQADLYYKVNSELAIAVATKVKQDGVKQFIFMSSMIVYGDGAPVGKRRRINRESKVYSDNFYGDSKIRAEKGLLELMDDNFKVVILRPPMIYGKNSKGNFPKLVKLSKVALMFPKIENERSFLYIKNLAEFIKQMIINDESGIFFPQNPQHFSTSQLVKEIRAIQHKKTVLVPGFGGIFKIFSKKISAFNKLFGSLSYDQSISNYKDNSYQKYDLKSSLKEMLDDTREK